MLLNVAASSARPDVFRDHEIKVRKRKQRNIKRLFDNPNNLKDPIR